MALIKTDPSQTKTVIALLVVLLSAIGVTAYRVSPSDSPKEAAKAKTEEASKAQATVLPELAGEPKRNPFASPIAANGSQKIFGFSKGARLPRIPGANVKIGPWNPGNISITPERAASAPAMVTLTTKEEPLPEFKLMSTVKGASGYSAVIRIDGSDTRVVNINDKLKGGFKIIAIEPDRAVLTNGSIRIIATRPIDDPVSRAESRENAR